MTTKDSGPVVIDHVIGDRGRVVVHLASAELRLAATAGDRVVVRTPTGKSLPDRVFVETTDDGVTIREKDSHGLTFGRGRGVVQLEIELPPMAEIALNLVSGWLDAFGLTGEQHYRVTSSEIRLRECAGLIELNTVSGDAVIELTGATDLAIKSVSGDVVVRGGRLDALRIGTTSGDVRVDSPLVGSGENKIETLSGDVQIVAGAGMRVEARTLSGDLSTDLPHRSEGRMGRRTLIVGDGATELGFRSVSGDLRILDGAHRPAAPVGPVPPIPPIAPIPPIPPFGVDFSFPDLDLPDLDIDGLTDADAREIAAATAATTDAPAPDATEAERMTILRALESGELDVATAMDRLAAIDAADGEEPADG
jgi:hypothetical protein